MSDIWVDGLTGARRSACRSEVTLCCSLKTAYGSCASVHSGEQAHQ